MINYKEDPKGHVWKLDKHGEVDLLAFDYDDPEESTGHNGPRCIKCRMGFCEHCDYADESCPIVSMVLPKGWWCEVTQDTEGTSWFWFSKSGTTEGYASNYPASAVIVDGFWMCLQNAYQDFIGRVSG